MKLVRPGSLFQSAHSAASPFIEGVFRKQQLGTNQVAACDIQWLQGVGRCLDVAGCVRMARVVSRCVGGDC